MWARLHTTSVGLHSQVLGGTSQAFKKQTQLHLRLVIHATSTDTHTHTQQNIVSSAHTSQVHGPKHTAHP